MVMRSTTDQAEFLVSRRVAEQRSRGSMSSDAEAVALFESISLNLLLHPRVSLLYALLAKNGLSKAVQDELDSIEEIRLAIADLGNASFSIRSTKELEASRTALLQMEQLSRITTSSPAYRKFNTSVSSFLTDVVASTVKRRGATELVRPSSEAVVDLVEHFTELLELHEDVLDRLYSLVVGVRNFVNSPLSTIIGLTTAARARSDFEEIIQSIETNGSITADRDTVIRLLTDRAAIKTIGGLPATEDPVVSTVRELPVGYSVFGTSTATASTESSAGPFNMPLVPTVVINVNGTSVGPFNVPQVAFDLGNKAAIVSGAVAYPITVPADTYLFLLVNGVSYKLGPFTPGSTSLASILSQITAFCSIIPTLSGTLIAVEFIQAGTNRILIYHSTASTLSITTTHVGTFTDPLGGGTATTYDGTIYEDSIHSLIGFEGTEKGELGLTPTQFIVDAFSLLFSSIVTTTLNDEETFTIESITAIPGTVMTITAPVQLGLSGTYAASSSELGLYGTINGAVENPISPLGLVDIGDTIETPTGTASIVSMTDSQITINSELSTFDGNVTVTSALTTAYLALDSLLSSFLESWREAEFSRGLDKLNLAISTLSLSSPQSQRSTVLAILSELDVLLTSLQNAVEDTSTNLSSLSAKKERAMVDGISEALLERKFDRANSLLLKCRIQEALDSTLDTASFGGSILKASADFARSDLVVLNRAKDEGLETTNTQPGNKS